jgi:hypothetical protein
MLNESMQFALVAVAAAEQLIVLLLQQLHQPQQMEQ